MREKQLRVWKLVLDSLDNTIPVMLLYVLGSSGSSPGRKGFFMAVNANGEMQGSLGGGIMEHKFVEMAKDKLLHDEQELSVRKQIHDKNAAKNQSGMICSGEQTILLYRIRRNEKIHIQNIIECLAQNKKGVLQLSPDGIFFSESSPVYDYKYSYQSNEVWLYEEKVGYKNNMHIIGAGHCALALSRIMQTMDFYIYLYDDRQGLNTFTENEYAHEKVLINNYDELNNIAFPGNDYIVVMTLGYRTDDVAVRVLMKRQFKYLGILGSKKKIEKMFAVFTEEGIDENLIKRIFAPAGLPVNSQTPEEIAISIAAQIIALKNEL